MRPYVFKSDANSELRGFAGDMAGSKLPEKFRPWRAVGAVALGAGRLMGLRARASKKPSLPRDFRCGA
jgi:hypothetical protein